ncbi:hypothetical protein HLB23_35350 [Nocardia uniformis]|uniref:Uncharacterized protein n=1 Tax=Nocardia uniformis TaxID=53432 RepID=A0A849CGV6_9NOCA|nr:hypothetical protein [Nocardia uniformis]NNH75069.1 hypothetical protein [Nocardia uniformis]
MRRILATGMAAAVIGMTAMTATPAAAEPTSDTPTIPAGATIEPEIDCTPTVAHPYPIVVLPGGDGTTTETAAQWDFMVGSLRDAGYCTLLFQGGIVDGTRWAGDIPSGARQVADFIAKVKHTVGVEKVEIIAHSAGTIVTNYYLKVLGGAPNVSHAVFITPEARDCDGAGFLTALGIKNPPITPVQLLQAFPFLASVIAAAAPDKAVALQMAPTSEVYQAIFNGPIAQPGVRYSVLATRNDELATPAPACSTIDEPGVTMAIYEDLFPAAPPVGHSTIRSDANTAGWVLKQLTN